MFKSLEILQLASSMARHAGARQAVVSENVAHANTPNYKSKDIGSFKDAVDQRPESALRMTKAGHISTRQPGQSQAEIFLTDDAASPNGNTVSIETEILRSIEAEREQSRALTIYQSASTILKASIGRGR